MKEFSDDEVSGFMRWASVGMSPIRKAAAEAAIRAINDPGCLVRVTFTNADQIVETVAVIEHILSKEKVLDLEKSKISILGRPPVLEMKNGSGIEFVSDYKKITSSFVEKLETMMKREGLFCEHVV